MTRIFFTGASGYIGGDALYTIKTAHSEYEITALIRNNEKGDIILSQYQDIDLVYGTLEDSELLAREVSKADIVCHLANCEHETAAKAIAEGLTRNAKGYAIHLSGADLICYPDVNAGTYGQRNDRIFSDVADLEDILSPANKAPHREVDLAIVEAAKKGSKTAIVCPPTIYGQGRGLCNKRSIQVPKLVSRTLQRGRPLTDTVWDYASFFCGTNSLSRAVRAKEGLGWKPKSASIFVDITRIIEEEAVSLGIKG